jgi:hypothetical protein
MGVGILEINNLTPIFEINDLVVKTLPKVFWKFLQLLALPYYKTQVYKVDAWRKSCNNHRQEGNDVKVFVETKHYSHKLGLSHI